MKGSILSMEIFVHVASGFSKDAQGGNKAGVVFDVYQLTVAQKMYLANKLGYAETVFITQSRVADYQFEYFTPKEEVNLCGHATIGAFAIMEHLHKLSKVDYTIETKSGILAISIKNEIVLMEQMKPVFGDVINPERFENCFDIKDIDKNYQIQIVSTGLKDILIPIKSETQLQALKPNFEAISAISADYNVVGLHLFAFNGDRIICRNFAPLYEINEEAATGTSNGALSCYLYQHQYSRRDTYVIQQGAILDSFSEIRVQLKIDLQDKINRVYVGGSGYIMETKRLTID